MKSLLAWLAAVLVAIAAIAPALSQAQPKPVGIVTALQGKALLTRPAEPAPVALRFKDGVIVRDIIDTQEKSLARILFGGKSTVTVRELTQLEVREELLPTGASRAVHELSAGAVLVNVARQLMRPGDEVQIRTPNAVAAIRGSATFAQYIPALRQSFFVQISADAVLSIQGQPALKLVANTGNNGATVTGAGPQVEATPLSITPEQTRQIVADSHVEVSHTQEANPQQVAQVAVQETVNLANAVIEAATSPGPTTQTQEAGGAGTPADTKSGNTSAPVQPDIGASSSGCQRAGNVVKNCGFEKTGSIPDWDLSGAGSSITEIAESSGTAHFKPTEGKRMAIVHTGSGATSNTTSTLKQTSTSLQAGKVYLVTFDYLFMSNEFPTQSTTFNDTFEANAIDEDGSTTVIATESRNSSSFKTDKPSISGGGFTLSSGNGYVDCSGSCAQDESGNTTAFKTASKTVMPETNVGTLEFNIFDVGDTIVDSAVLIDNVKVELDPPLYVVPNGQTLTGPPRQPLVEFRDGPFTFDSALVASGGNASVNLSGPLLKTENSDLKVPYSLLGLLNGSRLAMAEPEPLVSLNRGSHALSYLNGTAIFDFWGTETAAEPETGAPVGTGAAVKHAGPLLKAAGGATIRTEKVLKLDTALLDATAPIIRLIGSPTKETSLTTAQSTMDLIRAKVASNGPVVALDKGLINVTNGALIHLTHGSYMKVAGDLLSLVNGSKINVVNGPLISVAGAGTTLDVSGALVSFGGTGGNKIVVNNAIAPTATLGGLPVSATSGGAISIGPNPIKSPSLGSLSVAGSLIQATNNGAIKIAAP